MSEIKGQLLGIVLVVAVFGVVGTALVTAFKSSAGKIANKVDNDYTVADDGTVTGTDRKQNIENNSIISTNDLLTF